MQNYYEEILNSINSNIKTVFIINAEKSKTVAFSSYAGAISSTDDFFLMDNDLFVMETTNSIFNETLYSVLTPKSLLAWIRVVLANRLSSNGEEWVENFARENSGTCNNQWQVLDLNKIDLENERVVSSEEAIAFAEQHEMGYLETSALNSFNIDEAFDNLIDSIDFYLE